MNINNKESIFNVKLYDLNIIGSHTGKGGVGKTTVTTNGSVAIPKYTDGNNLLMDMDAQANATNSLYTVEEIEKGLILKNSINKWFNPKSTVEELEQSIVDRQSIAKGLFLVPSDYTLEDQQKLMFVEYNREKILLNNIIKAAKAGVFKKLNIKVIWMDLGSAFGDVTVNAYYAAQSGIIQIIEPSKFSLDTLLLNINKWREKMQSLGLESNIKGIVLNKAKTGKDTRDMYELLHENFGDLMFDTVIPDNNYIKSSVLNEKPWSVEVKRLDNYKLPRWVKKSDFMKEKLREGNPILNLIKEMH